MTGVDTQTVLAAYFWVSPSMMLTTLIVAMAEGGIVVLPLALILIWFWPEIDAPDRRTAVVTCAISTLLAALVILTLGQVVDQLRPFVALSITPLIPHDADSSFPSDHRLANAALAGLPVVRRPWRGLARWPGRCSSAWREWRQPSTIRLMSSGASSSPR